MQHQDRNDVWECQTKVGGDLDLTLGSRGYFFLIDADRSWTSEARVPGPLSSQEKPLDCTFLIDRLFITFREKSEISSSFLFSLFSAWYQIPFLKQVETKFNNIYNDLQNVQMYLYIHLYQLIRMHAYRAECSIEGLESSIIKVILRLSGVNVRSDLAFLLLFRFVPHGIYRTAHTFIQTFIKSPTRLLSSTLTKRQVSKDQYHFKQIITLEVSKHLWYETATANTVSRQTAIVCLLSTK